MKRGKSPQGSWIKRAAASISRPVFRAYARQCDLHTLDSRFASESLQRCTRKIADGETVRIVGIGCGGHNTGVGLVTASRESGIKIISNHEEERFVGLKHCKEFPQHSLRALQRDLEELGTDFDSLDALVCTWDYVHFFSNILGEIIAEMPASLTLLRRDASPTFSTRDVGRIFRAPRILANKSREFSSAPKPTVPIIGLRHHDSHAYMAYGTSPFAADGETTLVAVIDGTGDDGSISMYRADRNGLQLIHSNDSIFDSIGQMFLYLSSCQGGWPPLSSEGRYMGAAAWGNNDRMTNPYYRSLREIFRFGPNGKVTLNRKLANWHRGGSLRPMKVALVDILGPPILPSQMWNPDHVLDVDKVQHAEITRDRVDKAAATQLVFEDAMFHVLENGIRRCETDRVVLAGGTALNCVASMRMLEHFDKSWFQQYTNQHGPLRLWIPPFPGDAGLPVGSAYHFACLAGAPTDVPDAKLHHPFLCGRGASDDEIESCLSQDFDDVGSQVVSLAQSEDATGDIADLIAHLVSSGAVVGLYQGAAESGPRALGHRSILADPTRSDTLEILNQRVKYRERIRPLAPMVTLQAAQELFELSGGAAADVYDAYSYMVLTARAKPIAKHLIPAVVHHDGTSRIQIVRPETNPLVHAYLKAMGRKTGVEASVNTSLNVGSPIAQTPTQAIETLRRSKGMHVLVMISDSGVCRMLWHRSEIGRKDGGRQLRRWLAQWKDPHHRSSRVFQFRFQAGTPAA